MASNEAYVGLPPLPGVITRKPSEPLSEARASKLWSLARLPEEESGPLLNNDQKRYVAQYLYHLRLPFLFDVEQRVRHDYGLPPRGVASLNRSSHPDDIRTVVNRQISQLEDVEKRRELEDVRCQLSELHEARDYLVNCRDKRQETSADRSFPHRSPTQSNFRPKRMWVIIVGASEYRQDVAPREKPLKPLPGSRKDADCIYNYSRNNLGIPSDNIQLLTDNHNASQGLPTRKIILQSLRSWLVDDPSRDIQYGDGFFFYYSGHGASYILHGTEFQTDDTAAIEALCPTDRGCLNSLPGVTQDISDRELNSFFSKLGAKYGRNITVVLDCCHGGGMDKSLPRENEKVRTVERRASPLVDGLKEMLLVGSKGLKEMVGTYPATLSSGWVADKKAFALISAAQDFQPAWETDRGGDFTVRLLEVLDRFPEHDITPRQLLELLGRSINDTYPTTGECYENDPLFNIPSGMVRNASA